MENNIYINYLCYITFIMYYLKYCVLNFYIDYKINNFARNFNLIIKNNHILNYFYIYLKKINKNY